MSKPTGKLAFAYQSIARLEAERDAIAAELQALKSAGGEVPEVLATVAMGGIEHLIGGAELGDIDIQPDMQALCSLQQDLVTGEDDVYVDLIDKAQHERIVAALKAQIAGQEPAGWQARFTSSGDERDEWSPCSKEHYELVKRCPTEWPGYEVREVFAAPPAAQDVSGLAEALELSLRRWASWSKEIATTPEFEEQQLEIAKCRRVLDAHRQAQQQAG